MGYKALKLGTSELYDYKQFLEEYFEPNEFYNYIKKPFLISISDKGNSLIIDGLVIQETDVVLKDKDNNISKIKNGDFIEQFVEVREPRVVHK